MSLTALVAKDALREWRGKESTAAGLVLVLLFFLLDLFAFPDLASAPRVAAAVLWTPILYGTCALAGRGFAAESDRGTLDLLRGLPVPLLWHGVARTLVQSAVALGLAGLTLAAAWLLFSLAPTAPLVAALALGAAGLAVLGSLAGGIAGQARSREVLMPVLVVPVAAPLLQAGVGATAGALAGDGWTALRGPLLVMVGYDLLLLGAAVLLWPLVLEGD